MKRREVSPDDRAVLERAARSERYARNNWDKALMDLEQAIKQASENGASLRAIAELIGRSHGRVRELLHR